MSHKADLAAIIKNEAKWRDEATEVTWTRLALQFSALMGNRVRYDR